MTPSFLRDAMNRLHVRMVGTGVGERTHALLSGLGWVISGAMLARVFTGIATLLAARSLGPDAWGRANLALNATLWLQIPLFLGLPTALMNAVPQAPLPDRAAWVRTGTLLLALTAALTIAASWIFHAPLARLLEVQDAELLIGVAWCVGFAVHAAASASLGSLERFKERAGAELAFALLFPISVVVLLGLGALTWDRHVLAMAGSYFLIGLVLFASRRVAMPGWDSGSAARSRQLLGYGVIAMSSSVAVALMTGSAVQVAHRHFPVGEVGVLAAVQSGSVMLALQFQHLLAVVFLPVASRTPDRAALLRKIARLLLPMTVASTALFAVVLLAWMSLMGREFPLSAAPHAAFALAAGLTVPLGFVAWLLATGGRGGAAAAAVTWLAAGAVNLGACVLLIPRFGILGAGLAAAAANAVGIAVGFLPPLRRWAGVS